MAKEKLIQHNEVDYNIAVQTIKDASLRSQYQAAKLVNREMLSLYYGIGRYISANSRAPPLSESIHAAGRVNSVVL